MMKKRNGYPVYPLTVAQKFHLFYLAFCPKKQVVNIGTSLTIETEIDWEELKRAIYKAYERCDSMRLRLAEDKDGNWYQYIVEKEERDIEFVDFSGQTMGEAEAEMRTWTEVPFSHLTSVKPDRDDSDAGWIQRGISFGGSPHDGRPVHYLLFEGYH